MRTSHWVVLFCLIRVAGNIVYDRLYVPSAVDAEPDSFAWVYYLSQGIFEAGVLSVIALSEKGRIRFLLWGFFWLNVSNVTSAFYMPSPFTAIEYFFAIVSFLLPLYKPLKEWMRSGIFAKK